MKKAIIAKKVGMTQIFTDAGEVVPVTVLQAGPCYVTQVKTNEKDGYESVQIGFGDIKEKNVWTNVWAVKRTYCSCRGPELGSQSLHSSSQPPINPLPERLTPSYGLGRILNSCTILKLL